MSPLRAEFEGTQPLATFRHFRGQKDGLGHILRARGSLATPTNSSTPGEWAGQERVGQGHKTGSVSKSLAPCHRGDSGTANIAAPKDSTTRAAKDGPVWFHCSAPAVRYKGKCCADSAHAENEPSMKGLTLEAYDC